MRKRDAVEMQSIKVSQKEMSSPVLSAAQH